MKSNIDENKFDPFSEWGNHNVLVAHGILLLGQQSHINSWIQFRSKVYGLGWVLMTSQGVLVFH